MNKKFSTLLVGLALTTAFSANAADPVDKQLHQLKVGGKYLSVTKSKVNTSADSLILVSEDKVGEDVMKDSYKKSLWKLTKGSTDNTQDPVWTLTNWATGNVLSLDLTKSTTTFAEGKQSKWLIADNGNIKAISGGKVYALYTEEVKDKEDKVVGTALKIGKDKTFVVGNIGNPYTLEADKTSKDSVTVGEISSFQLETIHTFHPVVSAILNITPDHLNRHHTMEAYVAAKEAVASQQTKADICVLNYDNDYTRDFAGRCPATPVLFSSHQELENGYFLRGDKIIKSVNGEEHELMDIHKDMNLVGLCNVENVMAAIAIAEGMQVPMETILTVIRGFHAVEHRIEFVATKGGVDYYNDSKGTNPDAAIQGIKAMSRPTVLIGGGYDKQSEYDEWIDSFDGKVKCLVLIGQTREKIAECARKHGFDKIRFADTYEECLKLCTELAEPGDAVLLSPACASWGMFPNYEVRGQLFKEYVRGLAD